MSEVAKEHSFYSQGKAQLDRLLIGENEAKEGVLVSLASGLNVVLYGPPSGGKTELAVNAHHLVRGIEPENVVNVPVLEDLAPQQLVGGTVGVTRRVTHADTGKTTEEAALSELDAMVNPDTQVLILNEINRSNPDVLKALLEAFESGTVENSAGRFVLKQLVFKAATMNPSERREGTHQIPAAWRSRFSIGVELGRDKSTKKKIYEEATKAEGGFKPVAGTDLEPVVNLEELEALRNASKAVIIKPDHQPHFASSLEKVQDRLFEYDRSFDEGAARFANRTVRTAQTLALLRSADRVVTEEHFHTAMRYAVMARVGMHGTGASSLSVAELTDQIVNG